METEINYQSNELALFVNGKLHSRYYNTEKGNDSLLKVIIEIRKNHVSLPCFKYLDKIADAKEREDYYWRLQNMNLVGKQNIFKERKRFESNWLRWVNKVRKLENMRFDYVKENDLYIPELTIEIKHLNSKNS